MSVVSVVLSGGGFCDGLITRPEQSYRICVCVCVYDREASKMMRPGPLWVRRTMKKKCDCGIHMKHGTYIYQKAISG